MPARRAGEPETFSSVRSMKHRKAAKSQGLPQANTSSDSKSGSSSDQPSTTTDPTVAGKVYYIMCDIGDLAILHFGIYITKILITERGGVPGIKERFSITMSTYL